MTLVDISHFTATLKPRQAPYEMVHINAGPTHTERIVPPAGEDAAFDVQHYKARIQICVSPTGRSVQVHVNGERVL